MKNTFVMIKICKSLPLNFELTSKKAIIMIYLYIFIARGTNKKRSTRHKIMKLQN